MQKKILATLAGLLLAASLTACSTADDGSLVIYSGRDKLLIGPLLDDYAKEAGVDITVRYFSTPEALGALLEEGGNTKVDVFISQDAGALGELASRKVLDELPASLTDVVDERFRDPGGAWVGLTGRVRVIAYNTDEVAESDVPDDVLGVIDPRWKGKVGVAPTNASFIAYVSALAAQHGEAYARRFLEGLRDNEAERFDSNVQILQAVASGEVQLGLVNHYYLFNELKEEEDAPVANHYPGQGDGGEGTFVNVSGAGIVRSTDQREAAEDFLSFLLGEEAQEYFRTETAEYPLRKGVEPISELPPLDELKTIDLPLSKLGADLEATTALIKDVGLT